MGDPERWPEASGLTPEGAQSFDAAFATFLSKGDAWWAKAELRAAELITSLQPNEASEQRRQDVIDYVRGLVKGCIYGQVGPSPFLLTVCVCVGGGVFTSNRALCVNESVCFH